MRVGELPRRRSSTPSAAIVDDDIHIGSVPHRTPQSVENVLTGLGLGLDGWLRETTASLPEAHPMPPSNELLYFLI